MKNSTVVKGLLLKLVIPYKKIAITKLYRDFFIYVHYRSFAIILINCLGEYTFTGDFE